MIRARLLDSLLLKFKVSTKHEHKYFFKKRKVDIHAVDYLCLLRHQLQDLNRAGSDMGDVVLYMRDVVCVRGDILRVLAIARVF